MNQTEKQNSNTIPFQIFCNDEIFDAFLPETHTIWELKQELYKLTNVEPISQNIEGIPMLDGSIPIGALGLKKNEANSIVLSEIKVEEKLKKTDTELAQEIQELIYNQQNYPQNYQENYQEDYQEDYQYHKPIISNPINPQRLSISQIVRIAPPNLAANNDKIFAFESKYSYFHPNFSLEPISKLFNTAKTQKKPLILYLHTENPSGEVQKFCTEILPDSEICTLINQNFLFWIGDIDHIESQQVEILRQSINLRQFPYLAIIENTNEPNLLDVIQGSIQKINLYDRLLNTQELFFSVKTQGETEVLMRKSTSVLEREEQDEEYERMLEIDQKNEEEENKKLEEQKRKEEQEKKKIEDEKDRIQQKISSSLEEIPSEPDENTEGVTQILFRKIDGSKFTRRFKNDWEIRYAFRFAESLEPQLEDFILISSYPRLKLDFSDKSLFNKTFKDLGLSPQAVLFFQEKF